MAPRLTPAALAQLVAPLRQAGVRLVGVGGLALVLTGLAVPTWLARLGIVRSPLWVVVAWLLAFLAAGLSVIVGRRVWRHFSATTVALTVERSGGWRHGAVTSLLEATSEGTSLELLAAADQSCATSLGERGAAVLEPERRRWAGWARIGHWALAAGVVGFAAVGPHRGVGRQLWSPGAAWASFLAPVQLVSDRTTVDRGESVRLDLRAAGRSDAELWLRAKGEPWRSESVALDSTGRATKTIGPLEGDFYALLQSGGRTSDTVLVHVRMPAFLGRLAVTANYPAYLRLEDETLPTTGDTLLLPAGTRLSTVGKVPPTWPWPSGTSAGRRCPSASGAGNSGGGPAPGNRRARTRTPDGRRRADRRRSDPHPGRGGAGPGPGSRRAGSRPGHHAGVRQRAGVGHRRP